MNRLPTKPRALVVEDDRALADIIRLALARAGHEVTVAHDGLRGLHLAQQSQFEVIVSDFQMPGLNGEKFLAGVRASGESRDAILVLCSAKSYEINSERLRDELGLKAVFYKPFSLNEMVKAIGSVNTLASVAPCIA